MRFAKQALAIGALASMVAAATGACNKNCNGHGSCGANDQCTCHKTHDFAGAEDCSQRVCPQGKTMGLVSASGVNDYQVHTYAECSNNGLCDRKTGECECFDGFTGSACQRVACPNGCSGHGDCQLLDTHLQSTGDYTAWDTDVVMKCKCDPGYEGFDCSLRSCPKGDDPLTTGQVNQIQTCTVTGSGQLNGDFTIVFTDSFGQEHETWPITVADLDGNEARPIKEALAALPAKRIPSVTVAVTNDESSASDNTLVFTVEFSDIDNPGAQSLLKVKTGAFTTHGSQPISSGVGPGTSAVVTCSASTATEENKVCAGRGTCDYETGLCQCHVGFHGNTCNRQTALT